MKWVAKLIAQTGFYPGGYWTKRIRHLVTSCLVVFSFFLNDIQNAVFEAGTQLVSWSINASDPTISGVTYLGQKLSPHLKRIQQTKYGWILEKIGTTSQNVENGLDSINEFQKQLKSYGVKLKIAAVLIRLTSLFLWLSITISMAWLICDLYLGPAKLFVVFALVFATAFNAFLYHILYKSSDETHQFFNLLIN